MPSKPTQKKPPTKKQQALEARQAAVAVHNRDLSTGEIAFRIEHAQTLTSMYEGQKARALAAIRECQHDVKTCDAMIEQLTADSSTLRALVESRRNS